MYSEVVKVIERVEEGKGITTLRFPFGAPSLPGQFIMIWIPGVDEVPMSISYAGPKAGITVKEVGEATKALSALGPGSRVGVRGPYGKGWRIPAGRVLCVGGGVGVAPIMTAVESVNDPSRVDVVIGARNAGEIIFERRARAASNDVRVTTDDGSHGPRGPRSRWPTG
jgi:dihydroorotate dehydrogenase electron transfer subunit